MKRLKRTKEDRMLGGVFGGLSEYYQTDPTILRLAGVFVFIITGFLPLLITYILAILIVPKEGEDFPNSKTKPIWKRWWFWLIMVTLVFIISLPIIALLSAKEYIESNLSPRYNRVFEESLIRESGNREVMVHETVYPNQRDLVIKHLIDNIAEPVRGGELFADYHELGRNSNEIYIWAYISEFYKDNGELKTGAGVSLPMVITFTEGIPANHRIPDDGSQYEKSIKRMFPVRIHDEVLNFHTVHRGTLESMISSVQTEAEDKL